MTYGSYPVESSEEANSRIANIFASRCLTAFHSDNGEKSVNDTEV